MIRRLPMLLLVALAAGACEDNDIGEVCKGMVIPNDGGASSEGDVMRAEGSEIVEYNTEFPCESTVCVATLARGGYCSRECRKDANCPSAFTCRVIMDMGPFAEETFCAWRECEFSEDCGDIDKYACTEAPELSLGEVIRLCSFRK